MSIDGNGFKRKKDQEFKQLLDTIDINEFYEYYLTHAKKYTAIKYNITESKVGQILDHYNLKHLTAQQALNNIYIIEYGSIENGRQITHGSTINKLNSEESKQKRINTCIEKYGGPSPFSSKEIQDKRNKTVQDKYGVSNVSKLDTVKNKIKLTHESRYGGIGWASDSGMTKYKETLMEKYGVEYACQLPQCINANHGCNSGPNTNFENLCNDNNLIIDNKEFVINNFRYDFKIGNVLIEINPSYSHNSTFGFKNTVDPLNKDYHYNKSKIAINNGYRCIHVWDWDDPYKIIQLLKSKEKIFARKCQIKEVPKEETIYFINKYHLQNYIKDDIRIGLYYENELISIMTFGKPRYNKKHQYELLRYCSSKNIIGGAEKLFSYFIEKYNPDSIISYCDKSKFIGNVYKKLNFISQGEPRPTRHWYNIKTKKHITDNLLRQRGFDQLFGTNYGKGTNNEQLMLENGFIEIYDCGQETFIWKNI